MDISRLRTGERLAGAAGIALLVFMFFDWFGIKASVGFGGISGITEGGNAFQTLAFPIDFLILLGALAGIGLAFLAASQRSINLPVAASAITAALGILATALVLIKIIDPPGDGGELASVSIDITRQLGVWLGLIASAGVAAGGWLSMKDEGTSFTEAREQIGDAISGGGRPDSAPSSPPAGGPAAAPPPPPPSEVAGGESSEPEGPPPAA